MSLTAEPHSKTSPPHPGIKDALDHVRAAAQELHGALSDAAAKRGGAVKADLEALPLEAKAIAESLRTSLGAQAEATRTSLGQAVIDLEATGKHAAEAFESSGRAAEASIQRAITDARSAVQAISEAVAIKRAAAAAPNPKS